MIRDSFREALPILEKLEKNGFQAYFVGGSVRDALINRPIGDIDITTSAPPKVVMDLFDKVIPIGIAHGTVIVRWQEKSFEVTTFRTEEGYTDFRHPDEVVFVSDIKEDLKRRDFTINAIAMDKYGNITDPFGGKRDIEERLIKAVGNPVERFREDPLRMMRAVRFVSQLNFQLDSATEKAIQRTSSLMEKIAVERIAVEIEKMFSGSGLDKAIEHIEYTGLHYAIPIWKEDPTLLARAREHLIPLYSMEEILAFFQLLGTDISLLLWAKEWKLSNRVKNRAESLLNGVEIYKTEGLTNWLVYKLPPQLATGLKRLILAHCKLEIDLAEWDNIYENLPIQSKQELAISGKEIIKLFPQRKKGQWIQEIIEKAEYQVVNGILKNDKKEIKEWVRSGEHPQTAD